MTKPVPLFLRIATLTFLLFGFSQMAGAQENWVRMQETKGDFPLVSEGVAARILFDENDFPVVAITAEDLAGDVEAVSGVPCSVGNRIAWGEGPQVLIGTLGHSEIVDAAVERFGLDLSELQGAWESFLVMTLDEGSTLLIAGSDRRGTAYGVYELSQAMGVSPWHWWADVPPRRSEQLYVSAGLRRFGPPSVKYRGIFINDEDWGLHPWASYTFDPELGDIGPRTYERVFELLLRLKANTLWPAMHEVTKAFNLYPESKDLADRYAIVMASSHAEPLLRNNVTEWTAPKADYNYATNADGVLRYWEQRLIENGTFENVYTLGMRGIHDSGMTAGGTLDEKVAFLERILADQRALLGEHVNQDLREIPQVFTPYKEVLELYRAGMEVPDEVTIVWPDDNHGYIRTFPNEEERARSGGSGIYYHISYLGAPLSYLWLNTTPPALIWEEMSRAYELGAQRYWILNVGDIKPGEIGMDLFLQMAWDAERWNLDTQSQFLADWAGETFGAEFGSAIGEVLAKYFELNFRRRPEHLQWYFPHQRVRASNLTESETRERLSAFASLLEACEAAKSLLGKDQLAAFFQLVEYPVKASAWANQRYFHTEQYGFLFNADPQAARIHGRLAREADERLKALTAYYNESLSGGKWQRFMSEEPADSMWRSYRTMPVTLPAPSMVAEENETLPEMDALRFAGAVKEDRAKAEVVLEAEAFDRWGAVDEASWKVVKGLGWSEDSIAVYPVTAPRVVENWEERAPWVEYDFSLSGIGEYGFYFSFLPTYVSEEGAELSIAVSVDGGAPEVVTVDRKTGDASWRYAVLEGSVTGALRQELSNAGAHRLRIYMIETGVALDRIFIHSGDLTPSFSGPSAVNR